MNARPFLAALLASGCAAAPSWAASFACDGKTDDSAAIQACVDQSPAKGAPCRLPPGVCVFAGAALTIPNGGGLTGSGSRGVGRTTLLLRADGGGSCGPASGGAIRLLDGNGAKLLADLSVRAGDPKTGCLVNASAAVKQVAGVRIEDVDFFPATNSTATVGLYVANIVTSNFERNYFAVGFGADIVEGGTFANAIRFRDNFFDELSEGGSGRFMVSLGPLNGSSFTGNVFESGPNGLSVREAAGVVIANNWMGDVKSSAGGTWIDVSGGGTRVEANFLNCEGPGARQRGITVSGRGGHVVEGNWIDGAMIAISASGSANVVKGNEIFYPESVGVEISSGTGQEIGPNDLTLGRRARAHLCGPRAYANKIAGAFPRGLAASNCAERNVIEDWAARKP